MKKILIAATVVGAVTAGLIIYLRDYYNRSEPNATDNVGDAANNALNTINRHISRIERKTDPVLN